MEKFLVSDLTVNVRYNYYYYYCRVKSISEKQLCSYGCRLGKPGLIPNPHHDPGLISTVHQVNAHVTDLLSLCASSQSCSVSAVLD